MNIRLQLGFAALIAASIVAACGGGGTSPSGTEGGALPTITSFAATPSTIAPGATATLSWSVQGATSVAITPGLGSVTGSSATVTPSATTTYTLTAGSAGGTVTASATVTVNSVPPLTYALSGSIGGAVFAGVTVTLTGTSSAATASDGSGTFAFPGLGTGSYTVTPAKPGYAFSPPSRSAAIGASNVGDLNFTSIAVPTFRVAGTVSGLAVAGVSVSLSGASQATTTTDASGAFAFTGLAPGLYTITPSLAGGYAFSPSTSVVSIGGADVTGLAFGSSGALAISGTVGGSVAGGVTVTLTGAKSAVTTTDAQGAFAFSGLADGNYSVEPSLAGQAFTPTIAPVILAGASASGISFTGVPVCTWSLARAEPLSGAPAGAFTLGGTMGTQSTYGTFHGQAAFHTGSDWMELTFPSLLSGQDVFAVQADYYAEAASLSAGAFRVVGLYALTDTAALGQQHGIWAGFREEAGAGTLFEWVVSPPGVTVWDGWDVALGMASVARADPVAMPTDGWHTLRVEGVRSACRFRALLDGVLVSTWTPTSCDLAGTSAGVASARLFPLGVGYRNVVVEAGSSGAHCVDTGTHAIQGRVSGLAVAGVTVTLSGASSATATTDATGAFSFTGLAAGAYTITPSLAGGYAFAPSASIVTVGSADVTGLVFVSSGAFSIGGTVTGPAPGGVPVQLSGRSTAFTTTDAAGHFVFSGLTAGSYSVTPSLANHTFAPASSPVTLTGASISGLAFVKTPICSWSTQRADMLSALPGGGSTLGGTLGTPLAFSTFHDRSAMHTGSDWMQLTVPSQLASADVFSVETDFFAEAAAIPAGSFRVLGLYALTDTFPAGQEHGLWAGFRQSPDGTTAFQWVVSPAGKAQWDGWDVDLGLASVAQAAPATLPTGAWHTLRVEGVRSACTFRALLDGVVFSTWKPAACDLAGTSVAVASARLLPLGVGYSSITVQAGSAASCVR